MSPQYKSKIFISSHFEELMCLLYTINYPARK